jgi:F0F1-type ATP synthase assembly protein I
VGTTSEDNVTDMKMKKTVATINATAARIISGAIIAIGVVLLVTNAVMTTPFIMGIALLIIGVAIIVLAKRHPLKFATEKL